MMKFIKFKKYSVLPGFGLTLGFTIFYLSFLVLIPLSLLVLKASTVSWEGFLAIFLAPRTQAAFRLTFMTSLIAALMNALFGLVVAWVLVRYKFPGKKIIEALIDLPFALPTAVAGICLAAIYSQHGVIGKILYAWGIQSAYSPLGITIALIFIGLPFVVRTVEPVLQDIDKELEEAAFSLGANHWQTFSKIIFPVITPSLLTGSAMAFARGLGEYGSVVFISGNMPMKTEIIPLLIMTQLEQYDYAGATVIAAVTLGISFALLFVINFMQSWTRKHQVIAS